MDLIFKRYSSPLLLLDTMIYNSQFNDFINDVDNFIYEDWMWELMVHDKVTVEEYNKFLDGKKDNDNIENFNLETTLKKSQDILEGFRR